MIWSRPGFLGAGSSFIVYHPVVFSWPIKVAVLLPAVWAIVELDVIDCTASITGEARASELFPELGHPIPIKYLNVCWSIYTFLTHIRLEVSIWTDQ